jgi:hypothetical protein
LDLLNHNKMLESNRLNKEESEAFWSVDPKAREAFLRSEVDLKIFRQRIFENPYCYLMSEITVHKHELLEKFGAPESVSRNRQAILELNLDYINWLLCGANGFVNTYIKTRSTCFPMLDDHVRIALEIETPRIAWLLRCVERTLSGGRSSVLCLSSAISEFLANDDDSATAIEKLYANAQEVFPYWKNYNISCRLWDEILFSQKRDVILATLAALDRSVVIYDKYGIPEKFATGLLDSHIGFANAFTGAGSVTSFLNAIIIDRISAECPVGTITEDFSRAREQKGVKPGSVSNLSFRPVSLASIKQFVLNVPKADRESMRRMIVLVGIAVSIVCRDDEAYWPRALKNIEQGRKWREAKRVISALLDSYNLCRDWNYAITRGLYEGTWADCRANEDLLCGLDYTMTDFESAFLREYDLPREPFSARCENRSISSFNISL